MVENRCEAEGRSPVDIGSYCFEALNHLEWCTLLASPVLAVDRIQSISSWDWKGEINLLVEVSTSARAAGWGTVGGGSPAAICATVAGWAIVAGWAMAADSWTIVKSLAAVEEVALAPRDVQGEALGSEWVPPTAFRRQYGRMRKVLTCVHWNTKRCRARVTTSVTETSVMGAYEAWWGRY